MQDENRRAKHTSVASIQFFSPDNVLAENFDDLGTLTTYGIEVLGAIDQAVGEPTTRWLLKVTFILTPAELPQFSLENQGDIPHEVLRSIYDHLINLPAPQPVLDTISFEMIFDIY